MYFYAGAYINDNTNALPYMHFAEHGLTMEGLPDNVILKRPSHYGIDTMEPKVQLLISLSHEQ